MFFGVKSSETNLPLMETGQRLNTWLTSNTIFLHLRLLIFQLVILPNNKTILIILLVIVVKIR